MTTNEYLQAMLNGTLTMADIIPYGLTNALTVMLVVFAVLGILFLILTLSGAIFSRTGKKPKQKSEKPAKKAKTEKAPESPAISDEVAAVLSAAVNAAQNDGEIIAVLTAAVCAARAEQGESGSFRVVSFRRR